MHLPPGRFSKLLVLGVVSVHLWSLVVFGATFWVDSSVYASLAETMISPAQMSRFFGEGGALMFSHLGPVLPFLWSVLQHLPTLLQWPALALLQHGLAAWATCLVVRAAHRLWPSWWHLVAAAVFTLLPFYQAMHNSLMTESLSSSLLLIGLALYFDLLRQPSRRAFLLLLLVMGVLTDVRYYGGIMLAIPAAIILWRRERRWSWPAWAGLALAFVGWLYLFPVYRWVLTKQWIIATGGTNVLTFAVWANPDPSPAAWAQMEATHWLLPEEEKEMTHCTEFSLRQADAIGERWLHEGATLPEAVARAHRLSAILAADDPTLWLEELRAGLVSCGFLRLASLGSEGARPFMRQSLGANLEARLGHLRWISWLERPSYKGDGAYEFLGLPMGLFNSVAAQKRLWAALGPYTLGFPTFLRDPLRLGEVPTDLWAALGLLGGFVCLVRCWPVGVALLLPAALTFGVTGLAILNGTRYCYVLLPVDLLSVSMAIALLRRPGGALEKAAP